MFAEPHLDETVHALTRLRLCGLLRRLEQADFKSIASLLEISDANLSKTIRILVEAGYIETSKAPSSARDDARRTTTVKLTSRGSHAFDGHIAALRIISDAAIPASS